MNHVPDAGALVGAEGGEVTFFTEILIEMFAVADDFGVMGVGDTLAVGAADGLVLGVGSERVPNKKICTMLKKCFNNSIAKYLLQQTHDRKNKQTVFCFREFYLTFQWTELTPHPNLNLSYFFQRFKG